MLINGWAKQLMRWHLLVLIVVFVFANHCRCQEEGLTNHSAPGTNSLSSLEPLVVGTWRVDFPEAVQDGTNVFLQIQLSADRKWHWSVFSDNPRTDPNEQSGTWFVHERILVLRVAEWKAFQATNMAYLFDIKSLTRQYLALTNSFLGDRIWTRIAQPGGSQPIRSETHAPPAPQRQVALKDVKDLIDNFCARERNGEKLTPADGIFATMQQLVSLSPPDVVNYIGDNLDDNSGFLWVVAGSPKCSPKLLTRFLAIPSTHTSIAMNPMTSPQVLESLSHSTNWQVRASVAANANTPKATLEQLASDREGAVRESAERNLKPKTRQQ